jgi:hypothetical protein
MTARPSKGRKAAEGRPPDCHCRPHNESGGAPSGAPLRGDVAQGLRDSSQGADHLTNGAAGARSYERGS